MTLLTRTALLVAVLPLLSLTPHTSQAATDGKNYGGMLCRPTAGTAGVAYYDNYGRVCNDSGSQPLSVICPLTQDQMNTSKFHTYFDYVMWNLHGLNGNQNTYPAEDFTCHSFSRTRHGVAYYWSGWQSAGDQGGNNYGATPTHLVATTNQTKADGFIGARCQIPDKYNNQRSCLSHLCVDEVH